jgi:uncharacterized protein YndB with AHSA1/START domain
MTVTAVTKDLNELTMTVDAEFDVPVDRAWQLWGDPRQLERWWGPPTHPATMVQHDLTSGGTVTYYMTGPEGERFHGWWRVTQADAPRLLVVEDGFADENGQPNPDLPVTIMRVSLDDRPGGGTAVTITSTFASLEAMEQLISMGMEEGLRQAMAQMDAILAA